MGNGPRTEARAGVKPGSEPGRRSSTTTVLIHIPPVPSNEQPRRSRTSTGNVEFISFREQIDTGGPLGRAIVVIIGAIAELERNLIVERVRAGMRRARLEGRHIGRRPLDLDREAILRDRRCGHSLGQIAKAHSISRATVHRVIHEPASIPSENVA
jgi:hypothetical protein